MLLLIFMWIVSNFASTSGPHLNAHCTVMQAKQAQRQQQSREALKDAHNEGQRRVAELQQQHRQELERMRAEHSQHIVRLRKTQGPLQSIRPVLS